jgi:hypothetical protein
MQRIVHAYSEEFGKPPAGRDGDMVFDDHGPGRGVEALYEATD